MKKTSLVLPFFCLFVFSCQKESVKLPNPGSSAGVDNETANVWRMVEMFPKDISVVSLPDVVSPLLAQLKTIDPRPCVDAQFDQVQHYFQVNGNRGDDEYSVHVFVGNFERVAVIQCFEKAMAEVGSVEDSGEFSKLTVSADSTYLHWSKLGKSNVVVQASDKQLAYSFLRQSSRPLKQFWRKPPPGALLWVVSLDDYSTKFLKVESLGFTLHLSGKSSLPERYVGQATLLYRAAKDAERAMAALQKHMRNLPAEVKRELDTVLQLNVREESLVASVDVPNSKGKYLFGQLVSFVQSQGLMQ